MPRWPIIPDRTARTLAQLLGYAPERISGKWVNISEAFDTHSGSIVSYAGSAGATLSSFSSSATGTIFQVQNNVAADGWREAPCKALPMTTVFPAFVNDGRWHLTILGIANATFGGAGADKWQGCGITGSPDGSANGAMLGFRNFAFSQYAAGFSPTGWTITSGSASPVRGVVSRLLDTATYFSTVWTNSSLNATNGGAVSGDPYITVAAGCDSTGSTGPHTTDVTWFGFISELPDTAPY